MEIPRYLFSIDVKAVGLYGDPFAYGWSVVDITTHKETDYGFQWCLPNFARGTNEDRKWTEENVLPDLRQIHISTVKDLSELLDELWKDWNKIKEKYTVEVVTKEDDRRVMPPLVIANHGFPIVSGLFYRAVNQKLKWRRWKGPYLLHEVATYALAANVDPHSFEKRECEQLEHNPLHNSRFSARVFLESHQILRKRY